MSHGYRAHGPVVPSDRVPDRDPRHNRLRATGSHALVALKTSGADPVHKATIMPRGQALGMVMQLPSGDQTSLSRKQMLAKMDVCMGGAWRRS